MFMTASTANDAAVNPKLSVNDTEQEKLIS